MVAVLAGGGMLNQNVATAGGSTLSANADGGITSVSINGVTSNFGVTNSQTRLDAMSKTISNGDTMQRLEEISNGNGKSFGLNEEDVRNLANAYNHAKIDAYNRATGANLNQDYFDKLSASASADGSLNASSKDGGANASVKGNVTAGTGMNEVDKWFYNLSKAEQENFKNDFTQSFTNKISQNESTQASYNELLEIGHIAILVRLSLLWILSISQKLCNNLLLQMRGKSALSKVF